MATALHIRDVTLVRREVAHRRGKPKEHVEAIVAVENASKSETLFVSTSLRFVAFDENARRLTLSTAEPQTLTVEIRHFMLPTIVPLEPEKLLEIHLTVPLRFVQISGFRDGRFVTETGDLGRVTRVRQQVAFGLAAFRPIPQQTAEDLRRQLLEWQQIIEGSFERTLTTAEKSQGDSAPRSEAE